MTKNTSTDTTKVECCNLEQIELIIVFLLLIPIAVFFGVVIVFLIKKDNEMTPTPPGETTPLLQNQKQKQNQKYEHDQPPSYAELSPNYPSPPAYEELHVVTGKTPLQIAIQK